MPRSYPRLSRGRRRLGFSRRRQGDGLADVDHFLHRRLVLLEPIVVRKVLRRALEKLAEVWPEQVLLPVRERQVDRRSALGAEEVAEDIVYSLLDRTRVRRHDVCSGGVRLSSTRDRSTEAVLDGLDIVLLVLELRAIVVARRSPGLRCQQIPIHGIHGHAFTNGPICAVRDLDFGRHDYPSG